MAKLSNKLEEMSGALEEISDLIFGRKERISMGLSLFEHNTRNAKIQGLSVQAGELFADMYKDHGADANATLEALEAYKSLRRLLPREKEWDDTSRHTGATAAHKSTQGVS